MSEQPAFEWGVLTESWWRENGAACRASELQIRFACARHLGANKAKSAALAGYSGGPEALRSAGVRAEGTKAVEDLLTLAAAAESPGDADTATATEIDRKLTKLIRSPDGALSLKAIEARDKRNEHLRARGETPADDGFSDWRSERDYLTVPNGGCAYLVLKGGQLDGLTLLHDTYAVVMREPLGPELWSRFYALLNDDSRARLDRHLADPGYQLDVRRKIWGEIGMTPPAPIKADAIDMLRRDSVPIFNAGEASVNAA